MRLKKTQERLHTFLVEWILETSRYEQCLKAVFINGGDVSCVGLSDSSSKEKYIEKMEKGLNEKGEVYRRMVP